MPATFQPSHIATYQTLDVGSDDGTTSFLTTYYPENYFSHIIIDECHRSAWGKWSQVLTRNSDAVQIGLTATPRHLEFNETTKEALADAQITADNSATSVNRSMSMTSARALRTAIWPPARSCVAIFSSIKSPKANKKPVLNGLI